MGPRPELLPNPPHPHQLLTRLCRVNGSSVLLVVLAPNLESALDFPFSPIQSLGKSRLSLFITRPLLSPCPSRITSHLDEFKNPLLGLPALPLPPFSLSSKQQPEDPLRTCLIRSTSNPNPPISCTLSPYNDHHSAT